MQIVPVRKPAGLFAVVDDDVAEWASGLRLGWRMRRHHWDGSEINLIMHSRRWLHRSILQQDGMQLGGLVVHHANGLGWDCRRENLRVTTLAQSSRLYRSVMHGVNEFFDLDSKGRTLSSKHYVAYHRHKKLGTYPTREEALAAKIGAETADGFPLIEDREALLKPVIEFLEECVAAGTLRRHIRGAQLHNCYRIGERT